jgi:hypothetical protein
MRRSASRTARHERGSKIATLPSSGVSISTAANRRPRRGGRRRHGGKRRLASTHRFGRETGMRVMVIVKANDDSEAGRMPSEQELAEMGQFNEQLAKAGVMLAGEGLHPSAKGKRVRFDGAKPTVIDGPFAETKELIAGFWLWQVSSMDEAVEWLKRSPFRDATVEIRPVFEADDFGPVLTPELRAQEDRIRAQLAEKQQG